MSLSPQRQIPSTAPDRSQRYREIALHTLRTDTIIPFVLYTQIEGEFLAYRRENLPFTQTQLDALIENEIDTLFVSPDQAPLYWEYLSQGIAAIISDESQPLATRSKALYESTEQLSSKVTSTPVTGENVQIAQDVVSGSIQFQKAGRTTLHSLMLQMQEETEIHSRALNACQYGLALAREMNALTPDELEAFGMGMLMMDLGMLQIPEALQKKDGPFSFDEWSLIKRHPAIGLEMIEGIPGIPELAREVIFGHHERLDGSGYPQGLGGSEISLPLRIVAVVDTFATLTSAGVHREPLGTFAAIQKMHTEMRSEIDLAVLTEFVRMLGRTDEAD